MSHPERQRHHTDKPQEHNSQLCTQSHRDRHHQPTRILHRHVSDVSSDRMRYFSPPFVNHRPIMEGKRTDYPRKPRNSRSDASLYSQKPRSDRHSLPRDLEEGGSSQGSQGSGQMMFRPKQSSSSSLERSLHSAAESHSSFNGSFYDGTVRMVESGFNPELVRNSGTPNSSQSDESNLDRMGASYMPRSLSSQGVPLSSYSSRRGGWLVDDVDGRPSLHPLPLQYPYGTNPAGERRSMSRSPMPLQYHHPQSPISPVSPMSSSYSSENDSGGQLKHTDDKPWYEQEDPDIHPGLYFPESSKLSHQTIPTYNNGSYYGGSSIHSRHSPQHLVGSTEHKRLAKQRIDYYFAKQDNYPHADMYRSYDRRESSPADISKYHSIEPEHEGKFSDSEIMKAQNQEYTKESNHKKVKRVKSGGIGIGKFVKKIGNRKGRSKDELISEFRGTRSHSLENLTVKDSTNLLQQKYLHDSPAVTPKLSKLRHRQNSEPDLENAVGLFRTNSKKNLLMDQTDSLFEAIESMDYEKCCTLLEDNQVHVNQVNDDDWTPLDIAVMLNDQIADLLLQYGARDSNKYFKNPGLRYNHVLDLLGRAEREKRAIAEMSVISKEMQKQLNSWRNRILVLEKMLSTVQRASPPGPPRDVALSVTSDRSINVKFSEPESTNGAQVTRYKIQWGRNEHFAPESGEFVLCDSRREYTIPDLDKGARYFVRVYAFNMKGFGPPKLANPSYAVPSSWHDYSGSLPRFQGCTDKMGVIAGGLNKFLAEQQQIDAGGGTPGTPNTSKRSFRRGLTRLFSQGARFCRTQKSGVYLACLMHSDEGRILVTVDDYLPVIEVSDSHPSSIGTDFAWLTKLSSTWENIREMCESTEGHTTSPAIQFRFRLLQAVASMQIGTGQTNLGLIHHRTFDDSHGTTIFLAVQYIEDHKSFTGGNKWTNYVKIMKKYPQIEEVFGHELTDTQKNEVLSAIEQLIMEIPNIIHHHSNCHNTLSKGLYLGYLKARLSLASMTLVTSSTLPNVFPHCQIRSNPNISKEEWAWIHSLQSDDYEVTISRVSTGSQVLQKILLPSIDHFFEILGIPPEESENHQLYIDEVIELNENVTFLLLMPPPEYVCTPPGGKDIFDGQHFSHLPISAFELLQLYTYQRAFVNNFSSVSCRLDIEIPICQKRMRESLSKSETSAVKEIKNKLEKYHEETEAVWKHMRWIETAIQTARNTSSTSTLTIQQFRNKIKQIKKALSASTSASSISTMMSSSSSNSAAGGTLSPSRKSLPSVTSVPLPRQLTVFPGYETGLPKGTTVTVPVNTATRSIDVIRFAINVFEQAGYKRQYTERELKDFYLAAVKGHQEEILPLNFTPLELLNVSNKYRFVIKKFSMNQCTTEV